MWAALLGVAAVSGANGHSADEKKRGCGQIKKGRNVSLDIEAKLNVGKKAFLCLVDTYGEDVAKKYSEDVLQYANRTKETQEEEEAATRPHLPYGFWSHFMKKELKAKNSGMKRAQASRGLKKYVIQRATGAEMGSSLRDGLAADKKRNSGAANNSLKAAGLGYMLFQFFVDHVQNLNARADSLLLMRYARESRVYLLRHGWADAELPKLVGNAGHQWFKRWRKTWNIVKKGTGMKLKVSWKKVLRRVQVLLTNIFRHSFYVLFVFVFKLFSLLL